MAQKDKLMGRFRVTIFSGERARQIWSSTMMSTPVCIETFQSQLLVPRILDHFPTLPTHLQTEECKPWNDMIFQRYVLAASYRQVFETLPPQTEHGGYQNLAADGSVVELKALQAAAEGVDNVKKELIEGIISGLSCDRAICPRDICCSRGRRGRGLKKAER